MIGLGLATKVYVAVGATDLRKGFEGLYGLVRDRLWLLVYAGYFSNFGNAGFIWSHGCASDVHTSTCGLNQLGSSKLAVLIATNWGTESGLTTIGEPQSGQKPRRVLPPISLGEAWKRGEPCKSLKASVGTMTKDENGPPLDCWQSRQ